MPLLREDAALGVILLRRSTVKPFDRNQIALLETFADQAAIAIENVRLFNETREALEQQKASGEVLAAISSSIADTAPGLRRILASCERLFAGHSVGVINLSATTACSTSPRIVGPGRDELAQIVPARRSPTRRRGPGDPGTPDDPLRGHRGRPDVPAVLRGRRRTRSATA